MDLKRFAYETLRRARGGSLMKAVNDQMDDIGSAVRMDPIDQLDDFVAFVGHVHRELQHLYGPAADDFLRFLNRTASTAFVDGTGCRDIPETMDAYEERSDGTDALLFNRDFIHKPTREKAIDLVRNVNDSVQDIVKNAAMNPAERTVDFIVIVDELRKMGHPQVARCLVDLRDEAVSGLVGRGSETRRAFIGRFGSMVEEYVNEFGDASILSMIGRMNDNFLRHYVQDAVARETLVAALKLYVEFMTDVGVMSDVLVGDLSERNMSLLIKSIIDLATRSYDNALESDDPKPKLDALDVVESSPLVDKILEVLRSGEYA